MALHYGNSNASNCAVSFPDLLISAELINANGFHVNWIYPSDLTSLEGFDVRLDYLGACEELLTMPPVILRQPPEARSFIFSELEELSVYNVTVIAINSQEFRAASMSVITNAESKKQTLKIASSLAY